MRVDELDGAVREQKALQERFRHRIYVCTAAGCLSLRSGDVHDALREAVKQRGLEDQVAVSGTGCLGLCARGPLVLVEPGGVLYGGVKPDDACEIVDNLDAGPVERLRVEAGDAFYGKQRRIVLENSGRIDPEKLEDYLAADGYAALMQAISEMTPHDVVQEVSRSGLRGRGGAGYPTGLKWSTVYNAPGPQKFVVCNADEGDPGAFMDRSVLESDPHRVLEGMAIAGYAVGADHGFIYCRAEYPLAIERLRKAIRQAKRAELIGDGIAGSSFSFEVEIRLGAGAFVCGEETALMASIEGKQGRPRPRPPYPANYGLWGRPTLINNVETFANVAPIVRKGADWFSSIGTKDSKGTKVFALAGKVQNTGLIEVPMGTPLRQIIFEIGGGVPKGRQFKAVQTGGPSGGCIPAELLDIPVDYESLKQVGSIMGSGGMIVMDDRSCMVDVAKYFMDFCRSESCGKCVPCRVGTTQMYNLLAKITRGRGSMADLDMLEDLCDLLETTSLCGLGTTAPNPVRSTLRYFRHEYLAHIRDRECPAGVCKMAKAAEATT